MKRKRHPPEEIIKKLRKAEGLLAVGKSFEEACRALPRQCGTTSKPEIINNPEAISEVSSYRCQAT
jgi:hypothetical protein